MKKRTNALAGLTFLAFLAVATSGFARPRPAVIRPNSVTASHIRNGAVTAPKIADGAVTESKIANEAVTAEKISPDIALWSKINGDAVSQGWVGIGGAPQAPMHVRGGTIFQNSDEGHSFGMNFYDGDNLRFELGIAGGPANYSLSAGTGDTVLRAATGQSLHLQSGNGDSSITIDSNNWVGINNASPLAPLHVSGSINLGFQLDALLNGGGALDTNNDPTTADLGIISDFSVRAQQFLVLSDSRIKTDQHVSDSEADLATLLGIQITDYTYVDKMQNKGTQKKVIAQQVEEVYPLAVGRSTGVVPDIYQAASVAEGWVDLETDLKVGERVKLIGNKGEGVHEVLEVTKGKFRTAYEPGGEKVFVYGREVDDLRSVDYEAISMLNVSATQELAQRLSDQETENEKLKQRLTELEEQLTRTRQSLTEHREVASRLEQIERAVFKKVN